jgi:hypothetical protein
MGRFRFHIAGLRVRNLEKKCESIYDSGIKFNS